VPTTSARNRHQTLDPPVPSIVAMRLTEHTSLSASPDLAVEAESSSAGLMKANGHTTNGTTNGFSPLSTSNGVDRRATTSKVALSGTTLYNDSNIDREEFVRLVIQTLRDVGYACVPCCFIHP
jgi:WD repeat-containing protein 26